MSKQTRAFNPFYAVLVVVGMLFAVTACGYTVMTVQGIAPAAGSPDQGGGKSMILWLEEYGFTALMVELGILALATCGAIGTDEYWTRRAQRLCRHPGPLPKGDGADE